MRLFFDLLFEMTGKELRTRYKNTLFGFLWVVINPLIQMLVIGFIFRFFIKEPIQNYYIYLLVGLLVWNFFNMTLTKTTSSIVNERGLIKKAKIQREIIPLSIVLSNAFHLIVAFIILSVPIYFISGFSLSIFQLMLLGTVLLVLFTTGLSLLTSALNTRFRDVSFFVQALLIVWFYATPIIYSIDIVPKNLEWMWNLNPMTSIVLIFQSALVSTSLPNPTILIFNILFIILVAIIGFFTFKGMSKDFDDWI